MAQEPDQRSGGGLKRFAVTVLVLGLLGAVLWLASERNQRHYSWTVENANLVISKGRFFPPGQSPTTRERPLPPPRPVAGRRRRSAAGLRVRTATSPAGREG